MERDARLLGFLIQKVTRNGNQQYFSHFVDKRNLKQNAQRLLKVAIDCNQQSQRHIKVGIDRNQ